MVYLRHMQVERKRYLVAVITLVGTIVGVGIFGVPYAMSKVGVWVALAYFVALGAIQLLQSLFKPLSIRKLPERITFNQDKSLD